MERRVRILGAATTAVMLLAGCGGGLHPGGVAANPGYDPYNPGYGTSPGYGTTPGYGNGYDPYNPGYGSNPGYDPYNPGYGNNPGFGNTPNNPGYGNNPQPLIAKVDNVKNGSVMGMGRFQATVTVMNPSQSVQSGTLKVSILDNGRSIKDFTERVSIRPGESITKTYEDSRWKADNCSASIIPDNLNGDPYGNGNGYGNNPGYGNTYGNDPYGGGSTYGNDPYGSGYGNSYGNDPYGSGYNSGGYY